jgi:hypothetical protein
LAWRLNARRLIVSAFVLFHLSAICLWTTPHSYIKAHLEPFYKYYVLPTGVWQWWAIFAPDPVRDTLVLDAEIVDAKGMRHIYEFPRIAELPWWDKMARYRQPKFTGNMSNAEYEGSRKFAARYAARNLDLEPTAFPVWVSLYYQVKESPAPGTTAVSDPMAPARIQMIERFEFASIQEVKR